jgi:hypothetical protein
MASHRRLLMSALLLILGASLVGFAAEKKRDWQMGKILDTNRSRYFAGSVNGTNSQTAVYHVYETFIVEGDKYVYMAQERLRWKWSKTANVTVNGLIKYAVEKRKLFLLDEDSKEHEMEIVKKTLRLPDQDSK